MAEESVPSGSLLSLDPELQKDFQQKVHEIRRKSQVGAVSPGVIYIGHIPRALYEPQLREYFSQFGTVTRLRLSRSKKTGNSKGYAYVEFECDEVAKIVADTMNNYLFCERLLKCEFVPPEKVHPRLFIGCTAKFRKPTKPAVSRYNKRRSEAEQKKMTQRMLSKENKVRKRLAEKGIDYDFPGFAARRERKEPTCDADTSVSSQVRKVTLAPPPPEPDPPLPLCPHCVSALLLPAVCHSQQPRPIAANPFIGQYGVINEAGQEISSPLTGFYLCGGGCKVSASGAIAARCPVLGVNTVRTVYANWAGPGQLWLRVLGVVEQREWD
ncbi:hypothetical protein XENTR_v10024896 [Xenopus tropicalis]|nr:hypothetical protein XENTR_v10024896 [Xenopus tropicalis]